jgi:hypothetical protein
VTTCASAGLPGVGKGRRSEAIECHRLAVTAFGRAAAGDDADRAARRVAELAAPVSQDGISVFE